MREGTEEKGRARGSPGSSGGLLCGSGSRDVALAETSQEECVEGPEDGWGEQRRQDQHSNQEKHRRRRRRRRMKGEREEGVKQRGGSCVTGQQGGQGSTAPSQPTGHSGFLANSFSTMAGTEAQLPGQTAAPG